MFGTIKITDFAKRHFDPKFTATKITDKTIEEVEEVFNSSVENLHQGLFNRFKALVPDYKEVKVMDGYAPFCKLIAIPNFTNARVGSMKIDMANYQYLRHGYSARTEKELPVLSRWFELPVPVPVADYLMVVLYSKEQINKEAISDAADGNSVYESFKADWGVVAILGQTHPNEEPMAPITMMRNALGIEEGGSGVAINKDKYLESVEFWKHNAIVKS